MFVDNFSLAFTIAKMRSSSFSLLQVARRVGALRFASRIIPALRWLASECNVADPPSRIYINEQLYQQAVDRMQTRVAQAQRHDRAASGPFRRNVGSAQSCGVPVAAVAKASRVEAKVSAAVDTETLPFSDQLLSRIVTPCLKNPAASLITPSLTVGKGIRKAAILKRLATPARIVRPVQLSEGLVPVASAKVLSRCD